jgi:quinol-cytochrome oxidoreductase complex cytochrome b subunit
MDWFIAGVLVTLVVLWFAYDFLDEDQKRSKDLPATVFKSAFQLIVGFLLLGIWGLGWGLLILLVIVPPVLLVLYFFNFAGFPTKDWPRLSWTAAVIGGAVLIGLFGELLNKISLLIFSVPLTNLPKKFSETVAKFRL